MLTHNITALMGIPLLVGYVLFLTRLYGLRASFRPLLALALGISLATFFWMPALLEQDFVQVHQLYLPRDFDYHYSFISVGQLLASPRPVDPALANRVVPVSLGWIPLAFALVGWSPLGALLPREVRAHRWALSLALLGLALMTLPVSLPFWERVPLLRFIQFPWRFLAPATLVLALLAGMGAEVLMRRARWTGPLILLGLAVFALTWLYTPHHSPQQDPSPPDQIRYEAETGQLGATSMGDYLPVWVQERPSPNTLLPLYEAAAPDFVILRIDLSSLPAGARVLGAEYDLTRAQVTIESPEPFRLRFLWYFFPGWQGWLDGRPLPLEADGPYSLIAADVPAGRHEVAVAFGDTPLRRWAWCISGISGLLFLPALFWVWRTGPRTSGPSQPFGGPASREVLAACVLLAAGLTIAKTFYLDRYNNLFRRTLFDGRQVQGVDVPLEVNFGNQMVLMGYDLPTPTVRADEPIEVTLYWRILPPVTTDYSIGLHLVDERGFLYGQQDNMHPAYPYCPTSLLRPDQYARDIHQLTPWEGTPPGRYTLQVMVYDQSKYRLDLRDAAGNPLGTTVYPLTQVEIRRPRRFPPVEKLPLQTRLDAEMGAHLRLLGIGPLPETVETGQSFLLTLFWQAVEPPNGNYAARLHLRGADGTEVAEAIQPPGRADYPTSSWARGEIVRDVWSFSVPVALPANPAIPVPAGMYTLHLDLVGEDLKPISPGVDLGTVEVATPVREFAPPSVPYQVGVRLGEMATLLGYDLLPPALRPGETFTLTLYWRADALIGHSYTVFVHLIGPDGHIYAQQDSVPAG